jgi:hypothetical protein
MSITRQKISIAGLTLLAALAVGCQGKEHSSLNQSVKENSSKSSETTAGKTATAESKDRSPGKLTAPISIDYEVLGKPEAGQPVELDLKVSSGVPGSLELRLQPQEGLQMGAAQDSLLRFEAADTLNEPRAEKVVVVPSGEGRFYLSVLASVETPQGTRMRAVSIPIQVGDKPPTLRPNGELKTTEGETVKSLPAKESEAE